MREVGNRIEPQHPAIPFDAVNATKGAMHAIQFFRTLFRCSKEVVLRREKQEGEAPAEP